MRKLALCLAMTVAMVSASVFAESSSSSSSMPGVGGTSAGGLAKDAGVRGSSFKEEGTNPGAMVGDYFINRWWDLMDIVDFSLGAGPGFLIHVRATKLAQAIGGWSDSWRVGFRGRSAGIWREKRTEIGFSLLYYQKVERERISGWVESIRSDDMDLDTAEVYGGDKDRSFTGIGFTVHAGILVDVNIRPMQAADFVMGLFTIDVLDDDTGKLVRNKDL
ncbi:MAG: hypothetical protein HS116_13530 [Planctomycetes bacterium]|nr:hypothetical protein [Planctomycetota bacterium]